MVWNDYHATTACYVDCAEPCGLGYFGRLARHAAGAAGAANAVGATCIFSVHGRVDIGQYRRSGDVSIYAGSDRRDARAGGGSVGTDAVGAAVVVHMAAHSHALGCRRAVALGGERERDYQRGGLRRRWRAAGGGKRGDVERRRSGERSVCQFFCENGDIEQT